MRQVILGLLLLNPSTLYGLKKAMEGGISLLYSASIGSIKRALDELLASDGITVVSMEPGARGKKVYAVTAAGEGQFREWMRQPLIGGDAETESLARTYFLGLLDPGERVDVLEEIIARGEQELHRLTTLAGRLDGTTILPEHRAVFRHQRATLDYGIAMHETSLRWFRSYRDQVVASEE